MTSVVALIFYTLLQSTNIYYVNGEKNFLFCECRNEKFLFYMYRNEKQSHIYPRTQSVGETPPPHEDNLQHYYGYAITLTQKHYNHEVHRQVSSKLLPVWQVVNNQRVSVKGGTNA